MIKWFVYEFMKNGYVRAGKIPSLLDVYQEFAGEDVQEIGEGMAEFYLAVHQMIPESESNYNDVGFAWDEEA